MTEETKINTKNKKVKNKPTAELSILRKLNYIFSRRQKRQFVLLGGMILISGILETLGVSMLVPVVELIVSPDKLMSRIENHPQLAAVLSRAGIRTSTEVIILMLGLLIAIYVLKGLYTLFMTKKQNQFVAFARNDLISRILRDFLSRPYEQYLGADIPTVFRITDSDVPNVFSLVTNLLNLSTEMVVAVFLCGVLIFTNWEMTVFLVLVFALLTLLNSRGFKPKLGRLGRENQNISSRIAKWRLEAIYGLKDVKVLNRQDFFIRNYYESGKTGAQVATDYAVLNNLPRILIETTSMVAVLGFMLVYIARGGDITVLAPQLTAFAVAAMRLIPSVNRINTYIANIAYEEPSLNYVYDNLTEGCMDESEIVTGKKEPEASPLTLNDRISLEHITYRYPAGERNIFTDASMIIPKGKSVGIMGPSGAGKSTIVDILLGLLHAQEGRILVDGRDIFDNYDSWLSMVGYIPQTIYLIDESIRDNIAFGIDADKVDEKRIEEVLKEAQIYDFVKTLPEGLDTKIGDRGVRLSGGQRQRLGIARALYSDPEILVFDEATSALDNETEEALMEAINSFHGRKTMVIIAHRLNTIADCDIIYKVDNEKIVRTTLEGQTIYHTAE